MAPKTKIKPQKSLKEQISETLCKWDKRTTPAGDIAVKVINLVQKHFMEQEKES